MKITRVARNSLFVNQLGTRFPIFKLNALFRSSIIKTFSSTSYINPVQVGKDEHLWVRSIFPETKAVQDKTICESIWERSIEWGDATAYECGVTGRKISYNEFRRSSKGLATSLIKAGITNKATIALAIPNIPEYPIALFGSWGAGCTVSPLNPGFTAAEIKRQLQICDASCIITTESLRSAVLIAKLTLPKLKNVIIIGNAPEGCYSFYEMIKADPTGFEFLKGSDINMLDEIALLPFSSGTTGPPKGVMITHSNISTGMQLYCQNDSNILSSLQEGHQERMIGLLPFFHIYGSIVLMIGALHGAHMVTLPRFEPVSFAGAIKKHKPHTLQLVSHILNFLIQSPNITKEEFKDIHSIQIGATPVGASILQKLLLKADKYIFCQEGWGMTETSGFGSVVPLSMKNNKAGSCGTPISSTIMKVVDTVTGKTLGPNQQGELHVKGPQIMKGYLNNEKATNETIDKEGWLHTGDVGYYDKDKYFYIVDRQKELIKVKGFQVAPSELEYVLRDHEDVADVAVIGVANEEWGELPRAYIVLKSGKSPNEGSINSFFASRTASYKHLRGGIEFVESIPKAPSGKILRRELLSAYKQKYEGI